MSNIEALLPQSIRDLTADAPFIPDDLGMSQALRYFVGSRAFLKLQSLDHPDSLEAEGQRLSWLGTHLPAADILQYAVTDKHEFLLTSLLPGQSAEALEPEQVIPVYAEALARLHQVPIDDCPFDAGLNAKLEEAGHRVEQGWVNELDFEPAYLGMKAVDLFKQFASRSRPAEDLVVAHGDYCLPNLLIDSGSLSGLIDTGRLGVADRYLDLALAERSIMHNFGGDWLPPFYEAYGMPFAQRDEEKSEYYILLDEFF